MGIYLFLFGLLATLSLDYNFCTMMEPSNWFSALITVIIVVVISVTGIIMSFCAGMGWDEANKK